MHEDGPSLLGLEVEFHALLVTVEAEKIGALGSDTGGMPPAVIPPVGILDLEHIRAVIG